MGAIDALRGNTDAYDHFVSFVFPSYVEFPYYYTRIQKGRRLRSEGEAVVQIRINILLKYTSWVLDAGCFAVAWNVFPHVSARISFHA